MRTDIALLVVTAGLYAGLAMAGRHDADASPSAPVGCDIPEEVMPEHREGLCAMPVRIREFVARRDLCEHFLGEEPYDAERRAFLKRAIEENCSATESGYARLMRRYRRHPAILAWLHAYQGSFDP